MNQQQLLPPWLLGPFELIQHANEHLHLPGDIDRRIALIGFDNAIEVCIDIFLSLHPKVRGGIEISNDEIEKAKRNYHSKLEFFYKYTQDKNILVNVSVADIIWYHQLRNELYHSGNGLIPEINALYGARAAALIVFKSLFNLDVTPMLENGKKKTQKINNKTFLQLFGENISHLSSIATTPLNDAELVRKTLRTQGHLLLYQNKARGSFTRVCELPKLGFGVQVVMWDTKNLKWNEITTYVTNTKNLEELKRHYAQEYIEYVGELPQPIFI